MVYLEDKVDFFFFCQHFLFQFETYFITCTMYMVIHYYVRDMRMQFPPIFKQLMQIFSRYIEGLRFQSIHFEKSENGTKLVIKS